MSDSQVLRPEDFLLTPQEIPQNGIVFDNYNLEKVEKIVIQKTLKKYNGNVSQAAKELGLTRASLYRRMEKYEL